MATDEPTPPQDFAQLYEGAVTKETVSAVAKVTADKVLERFNSIKPYTATLAITRAIQIASAEHNIPEVRRLAERLGKVVDDEEVDKEKLVQLTKDYPFESVLSVYSEDLKALAFEIALIVLQTAEEEKTKSGSRSRGKSRSRSNSKRAFIIAKGEKSIEAMRNSGRPTSPGKDKDFFEFMGFQVSGDGKTLTPGSFPDINGNRVTSISRTIIINDLLAGNQHWLKLGYSIVEKPEEAPQASQGSDQLRAVS
ncbi:hypothetical protein [Pseudomonas serbica]|jgi:hypothetical protein|uniref:hypothetical protein n=1 Tax=Pseudomonas serbica TaxID=2965074 RepID=UPI00237A636A|nr:hypothetical protein [Pseudomonas serbica]